MAAIDLSFSAHLVQPVARRRCPSPVRKPIRSVSHSPPGLNWPSLAGELACVLRRFHRKTVVLQQIFACVGSDEHGRGKKSQRVMRFPVYESLYFLNRNVQDILVILEEIKNAPGMPQKSFEAYKVEIEYLRSHATQDVLEVMNDAEIDEMAKLGKQKKAYDDSIRDLDDVYFEVQHREEQRRKQGLPSLIGVLPVDYRPLVSEPEEPDYETVTSDVSLDAHSQNKVKSSTRPPHGKRSTRNSRSRRRTEKAS